MRLSKVVALLAAGMGFGLAAQAADAATLGGASLDISDGVLTSASERRNGVDGYVIEVSGAYFAESLIEDFAAIGDYEATILVWDAAGAPAVDLTLDLPAASIDDLRTLLDRTLLSLGLSLDYAATGAVSTATSEAGDFTLSRFIDLTTLSEIGEFLGLALGAPPARAEFSARFEIAPIAAAAVVPTAIPVPAALPLALSGFALLGAVGLRRRRVAA